MKQTLAPVKNYRNCGVRTLGSTYIATEVDFFQHFPFSNFVPCPPIPFDTSKIGLASQGLIIAERPDGSGLYDVYDKLGFWNYPPADFFVELQNIGLSRKVDSILGPQMSLLTPDSLYFVLSDHGWINNAHTLFKNRVGITECPKGHKTHDDNDEFADMCVALFWEDMGSLPKNTKERKHNVSLARNRPDGVPGYTNVEMAYWPEGHTSEYDTAIIMALPAYALLLEIIHDPFSNQAEETNELLESLGSNLPYMIVEE